MSIESQEELDGLRRAGRVVAVVLREPAGEERHHRRADPGRRRAGRAARRRRVDDPHADGALAAHTEHTIVVTRGAPLVLTR